MCKERKKNNNYILDNLRQGLFCSLFSLSRTVLYKMYLKLCSQLLKMVSVVPAATLGRENVKEVLRRLKEIFPFT